MASQTQTGTAVISGIQNSGTAITITGFATFILDGAKGGHKFDLDAVKENKFDVALIAANGYMETDVAFTPSGASKSDAAAIPTLISPLSAITLANFRVSIFNGRWIYVGDESIDISGDSVGKMSLKLRKYDDPTQNTSLSTAVS